MTLKEFAIQFRKEITKNNLDAKHWSVNVEYSSNAEDYLLPPVKYQCQIRMLNDEFFVASSYTPAEAILKIIYEITVTNTVDVNIDKFTLSANQPQP